MKKYLIFTGGVGMFDKKNIFFIIAIILLYSTLSLASKITDELKVIVDQTLTVMKDPAFSAPEKKVERNKLIHKIANEKFDWEEMAKRTLGFHWKEITPGQQKEFIEIFNDFLERTYISKIDLFLQESKDFTTSNISYTKETIENKYALVESMIALHEESIPLSYKLIEKNGKWVVYDMTIEGVGLVANYRTQYNEILGNSSFNELIEKLKSKEGIAIIEIKTEKGTNAPSKKK
jgi:phospholipid transport system substrate-binding protein